VTHSGCRTLSSLLLVAVGSHVMGHTLDLPQYPFTVDLLASSVYAWIRIDPFRS
jgi:hypothetical protein